MSTASRASTQLGYRFFPSILISLTELDYVFPQSVEVSRLVWLGLASGSFHRCTFVPLLLRVAAVASRCWSWEVWELLDIPLEVCQPCGTILGNGAGLEAAEWPGECLVSPWCLWLSWAAAMPRGGGWTPFSPSLAGHGPVSCPGATLPTCPSNSFSFLKGTSNTWHSK